MALTTFQESICQLLAENRIKGGESYVAGGAALNLVLKAPRLSRDVDIFHDSTEALRVSWDRDSVLLLAHNYEVKVIREAAAYVEAVVRLGEDAVLVQWVRDSAFRFFPLIQNERLGLTLHPFDLATNKVLALVGRLEIRDWIDVLSCSSKMQPLALLAWSACGKDPGFSPLGILSEAARSSHYSDAELQQLSFDGDPPKIANLSQRWKEEMKVAPQYIELLPPEVVGQCLLNKMGTLLSVNTPSQLAELLEADQIVWHQGTLGGVWPTVKPCQSSEVDSFL